VDVLPGENTHVAAHLVAGKKRAQLLVDEGAQRFLARQRRELFGIQPV
jgi:hypothetical protein